MVNDTRTPLNGTVEADETIMGGPVKGKKGRGVTHDSHASLVVGKEDPDGGVSNSSRYRFQQITLDTQSNRGSQLDKHIGA